MYAVVMDMTTRAKKMEEVKWKYNFSKVIYNTIYIALNSCLCKKILIVFYILAHIQSIFILSYISEFPSSIIFLQPEEFSFFFFLK